MTKRNPQVQTARELAIAGHAITVQANMRREIEALVQANKVAIERATRLQLQLDAARAEIVKLKGKP